MFYSYNVSLTVLAMGQINKLHCSFYKATHISYTAVFLHTPRERSTL